MEFQRLPRILLDVASSGPLTLGGYPHSVGHHTIARDVADFSSLDTALLSRDLQPRKTTVRIMVAISQ